MPSLRLICGISYNSDEIKILYYYFFFPNFSSSLNEAMVVCILEMDPYYKFIFLFFKVQTVDLQYQTWFIITNMISIWKWPWRSNFYTFQNFFYYLLYRLNPWKSLFWNGPEVLNWVIFDLSKKYSTKKTKICTIWSLKHFNT